MSQPYQIYSQESDDESCPLLILILGALTTKVGTISSLTIPFFGGFREDFLYQAVSWRALQTQAIHSND